jgi:hypothetical protein
MVGASGQFSSRGHGTAAHSSGEPCGMGSVGEARPGWQPPMFTKRMKGLPRSMAGLQRAGKDGRGMVGHAWPVGRKQKGPERYPSPTRTAYLWTAQTMAPASRAASRAA